MTRPCACLLVLLSACAADTPSRGPTPSTQGTTMKPTSLVAPVPVPSEQYIPPTLPTGLEVTMSLTAQIHAFPSFIFDRLDLDQHVRVRDVVLASDGNSVRRARVRYETNDREAEVVVRGKSVAPPATAETTLVGREYVVEDARQPRVLEIDGSPPPADLPPTILVARTLLLTHWNSLSHSEDKPPPIMPYVPIPFRVTAPDDPPLAKGIRVFLALETSLAHFGLSFAPPRVEDANGVPVVVRAFDIFDLVREGRPKPPRPLKGHGEIRFGPHDLPLSFVFTARREHAGAPEPPDAVLPTLTSSVNATWSYRLPTGVTWPHERSTGTGTP